jgi:[pyruvate, water dikinase]-phosphate phosphotransferase / [pyruvate, water dikinase] kinase
MLTVYVISDATGGTAERMARSALIQFENAPVNLVRRPNVRSAKKLRAIIEEAAAGESLILHTLVSDELRRLMVAETRLHGVDSLDMMGPILDRLAGHLKLTPQEKPGLFQQLVEARTREIEAVAFAFRHDDGQNVADLDRAEVVLVGISRTMKTPTMLYLAYRGWFAANVPLVPGITPPKTLTAMPAERVFCLVAAPDRLQQMRRVRAEEESIPLEGYITLEQIRRELAYAEQLCRKYLWQRIEVTGKSVEEVAREIILCLSEENKDQEDDLSS